MINELHISSTVLEDSMEVDENSTPGENIELLELKLSPVQIQQKYFENVGDSDWIIYEKSNRNYMLQNIAFALFGAPTNEGELQEVKKGKQAHLEGYTSRQRDNVMRVYAKVCEQSKYSLNNEDILMNVLLIVCSKPKPLKFYQFQPSDYWLDLHKKTDSDIWCTAVFRVRKCVSTGAPSCRVYIDENARVYKSWQSYLENNTQPKCVLILPQDGQYKGEIIEDGKTLAVKLTVVPSPTLGIKARVVSGMDHVNTVASLGALGVLGASMLTPVGPMLLAGATVATVGTGIYGLVRSSLHLRDRTVHEQNWYCINRKMSRQLTEDQIAQIINDFSDSESEDIGDTPQENILEELGDISDRESIHSEHNLASEIEESDDSSATGSATYNQQQFLR